MQSKIQDKQKNYFNKGKDQIVQQQDIQQQKSQPRLQKNPFQNLKPTSNYVNNDSLASRISIMSMGNPMDVLTPQKLQEQEQQRQERRLKLIILVQKNWRRQRARKLYKEIVKNYRYRRHIIQELMMTEKSYVDDLHIIIESIIKPLEKDKVITDQQAKIIRSNLPAIHKLNGQFLTELEVRFQKNNIQPNTKLGDILQKYIPFFRIYYEYYDNYSKSETLVRTLLKNNQKFQKFNSTMGKSRDFKCLDVESFIIKPIQRLPKYVLLLQDLLKRTHQTHCDYQDITKSLKQYSEVTNQNNMNLDKSNRIFELQNSFPEVKIADANRTFLSEEVLQVLKKNKSKTATVYFFSNLLLISTRKTKLNINFKPKLFCAVYLNHESVAKDMPDTMNFNNLITIIGENQSVTFIESNLTQKQQRLKQIDEIIAKLEQKSLTKLQAFTKNNKIYDPLNYRIEVSVVGTEQRNQNSFQNYTVYITEISINQIQQRIFLRYSQLIEVQDKIKKEFPKIQISFMEERSWKSGSDAKEIEARIFQVTSFLTTLLHSQQFKQSDKNKIIFKLLTLPENFYELPQIQANLTDQQKEDSVARTSSVDIVVQSLNRSNSSSILAEVYHHPRSSVNDLNDTTQRQDQRSMSGIFGKKYSATKLLRSRDTSIDTNSNDKSTISNHNSMIKQSQISSLSSSQISQSQITQSKISQSNQEKQQFIIITVLTYHTQKSKIEFNIDQNYRTSDLMDMVRDELNIIDMYDFKLMVPENDKKTSFKPLEDDEVIFNLFGKSSLLDKLKKEKNELYLRKYLYLDFIIEEQLLKDDLVKLDLILNQTYNEFRNNQYSFNYKFLCHLTAIYFVIKGIVVSEQSFPFDKLQDIIPSVILKSTTKTLWVGDVVNYYFTFLKLLSQENIADTEPIVLAKLVFLKQIYGHFLHGKQLFQVTVTPETQKILKSDESNLYLGIGIKGVSIINQKKNKQIKFIDQLNLQEIKVFPQNLVLIDLFEKKYTFNSTQGYQISQLYENYQFIQQSIAQKVDENSIID